jgi:beta-xylosidase
VIVRTLLAVVWALGLSACSSAASPAPSPTVGSPTTSATGVPGSTGTASPAATATPTLSGPTYDNPVYARDFPDPHVLVVDDTYYAYSTNTGTSNVPVISSTDLVTWERLGDAMPALPKWAKLNFGDTWAPGVIRIDDTFVLYHVSRDADSERQCIGVAVADAPEGPFDAASDDPFICQVALGGSIDPYPFEDEGQLYVYWKNDGNCCGKPVGLWVQQLSNDGLELTGEPVELIQRDQRWEVPLIENPAMVKHHESYYLFYSGNWWASHYYAVGYATCETAVGPCVKPEDEPIFSFSPEVMGPGGQAFFTDTDGDAWMAYHAWTGPDVGYPVGMRSLRIEPLAFEGDRPVITGPTAEPQPHDGA